LVTSDHNFVLSDQDGVLVGHMSFQVKKLFAALPFVHLIITLKANQIINSSNHF